MNLINDMRSKMPGKSVHMLRELTKDELEKELLECKKQLMREIPLKGFQEVRKTSPVSIRRLRKTIAKIKTVLREKSYRK